MKERPGQASERDMVCGVKKEDHGMKPRKNVAPTWSDEMRISAQQVQCPQASQHCFVVLVAR
jgi:hypothetical protein